MLVTSPKTGHFLIPVLFLACFVYIYVLMVFQLAQVLAPSSGALQGTACAIMPARTMPTGSTSQLPNSSLATLMPAPFLPRGGNVRRF